MSKKPLRPYGPAKSSLETDPRFPSGPWQGFFLMAHLPGRHKMELHLSFQQGAMTGEGRDMIGPFLIRGKYNLHDGRCSWSKRYIGKHDVAYQGYNEGKGIWGLWEIPPSCAGDFISGRRPWVIQPHQGLPRRLTSRFSFRRIVTLRKLEPINSNLSVRE